MKMTVAHNQPYSMFDKARQQGQGHVPQREKLCSQNEGDDTKGIACKRVNEAEVIAAFSNNFHFVVGKSKAPFIVRLVGLQISVLCDSQIVKGSQYNNLEE